MLVKVWGNGEMGKKCREFWARGVSTRRISKHLSHPSLVSGYQGSVSGRTPDLAYGVRVGLFRGNWWNRNLGFLRFFWKFHKNSGPRRSVCRGATCGCLTKAASRERRTLFGRVLAQGKSEYGYEECWYTGFEGSLRRGKAVLFEVCGRSNQNRNLKG